ncbi:ammonium transporter [Streptococcus halichoeri]|uniref:ammonium transporter n=1 Tax=Streptococcus halichoeri TaxID=254785 RepID=UPI00135CBC89|nr:ammonium transporter [Streptococcus halichoeri]
MFLLLSIIIMWPMLLGVAICYSAVLARQLEGRIFYHYFLAMVIGALAWLSGAYFLAFNGKWSSVFQLVTQSPTTILALLFQLCFCLYAVGMAIGSVIDRCSSRFIVLFVFAWVYLVYVPLAFLIWQPSGYLLQHGAVDFAGGMVVHLSAGVTSYVLAIFFKQETAKSSKIAISRYYLGMLLITFGWFGFNMGPVGQWNHQALEVLLKTFLAIMAGGLVWACCGHSQAKSWSEKSVNMLDGMLIGLVSSTAGVGKLSLVSFLLVIVLSSALSYWGRQFLTKKVAVNDAVDSVAINGLGGFTGSFLTACCLPQHFFGQCLALLLTIGLAFIVSYSLCFLIGQRQSSKNAVVRSLWQKR